ncbi:MAG: 50S ribosomal protein L31e [Candidatus Geothermarchaeota archaeon]
MSEESQKEISELLKDAKIVEERVYVVPLFKSIRYKTGIRRAKKAVTFLRNFIKRHMKTDNVKIAPSVNEKIWINGIRNPPRRIQVKVVRTDKGEVWVLSKNSTKGT